MLPSKMKAIKVSEPGKAEVQEVPLPKLRDDYILVKVTAVALNPTDWKHVFNKERSIPGATVGCDAAGIVEEVGPKVTRKFKKGDRICGFTHGVNQLEKEDGCFAEYAVFKGDIAIPTPDNLTDAEAATLGVGVITVGQGLYHSLELPLPGSGKTDEPVLIYGGSTATGSLAIQFAVLSGAKVVTTCGSHNFQFVKSLGAVEAFDYKDPDCAKKIREYTKDSLTRVFDTISEGDSPKICEESISSKGGEISYLLPAKHSRSDVKNKHTLAYIAIGEDKFFGKTLPANLEEKAFAAKFTELTSKLLADGKVKVHPPEVGKDGLKGVLNGLQLLKDGKVSGKKLVYIVAETP